MMNLKIDRLLPNPPALTEPFLLAYVPHPHPLLLLYSPPLPPQKAEQPKKKFTFKTNAQPVNTMEPVHLFNLSTNTWTTEETKGKFPSRRQAPAHVCLGPCLLLYGGTQISPSKQLNDLYALNLNTWQWKKLFTMEAPPASSKPIAVALSDDKLVIVEKEVWVFQAKGVNWETEATDLPGGIWEKVDISLSFSPLCGCLHEEEIIIFGQQKGLGASILNLEEKVEIPLSIEGEVKEKFSQLQLCSTSEDKGLLIDDSRFHSFFLHDQALYISEHIASEESFQQLTPIMPLKVNYGLTAKKTLVSAELTLPSPDQELPDTARHINREDHHSDPHNSSLIENNPREISSSRPPPSPLSTGGLTSPILSKLSPLLARQWLKRRVLQEKGKLLEDTIKKAQKMVLALCRYGDEEEKQLHIARVCRLRQSLCKTLQSETFIRRQMTERPGQRQLRAKALKDEHGASFFDPSEL